MTELLGWMRANLDQRCGFASAAALRIHFQKATSTSPLAYRRAFRQAP